MNDDLLQTLARTGAQFRLQQLDEERKAILSAFPDIQPVAGHGRSAPYTPPPGRRRIVRRRRVPMTAAQRKAVSQRMVKYWADRRKKMNGSSARA